MVYAPFVFSKLMAGSLADENRHVQLNVSDGHDDLFREFDPHSHAHTHSITHMQRNVEMFGRNWTFEVHGDATFLAADEASQPRTILIFGLLIDASIILLFMLVTKHSRMALSYADRLTRELKQQTAELKASNEELERFTYVASHDLKSPLRAIRQRAQWTVEDAQGKLSEDAQAHLNHITGTISRMEKLLEDLLYFARIGRSQFDLERVDCNELIAQISKDLVITSDVRLDIVDTLPCIHTWRTPLLQVLTNLISNALHHHDHLYPVVIRIAASPIDHGMVRFSVSDNGPGIAPEHKHKVFEIFQRLTHNKDGSTGVGLAIVRKWVQTMGGEVELEPNLPRGAIFHFTWPSRPVIDLSASK